MSVTYGVVGLTIFFGQLAYANSDKCVNPISYKDVIECAQERSPEVRSALLELERSQYSIKAAEQWQNPELTVGNVQGAGSNGDRKETDISLGVPLELGGKIAARSTVARKDVDIFESKLQMLRSKVRATVLLKLHRLRQALHEQDLVDEAIETFSKLIAQYRSRPQLSPEQATSSTVYQLSANDYSLKRTSIQDEISSLNTYFRLNVGTALEQLRKILPGSPKNWPTVVKEGHVQNSIQTKIAQNELDKAMAELSLARSEAWPTLVIGPSFKIQNEGGQTNSLAGFNLSLALPVFNVNGGARAVAGSTVKLSETRKLLVQEEQQRTRDALVETYERSIKALKTGLSSKEISQRHGEAEKLFRRGVVASSLVIEAHRSLFDLEKSRNERELKAIEALLEIFAIDGRNMEVEL